MQRTYDFTGAKLGTRETPLDTAGTFNVTIVIVKDKVTRNGDPMVSVKMKVVGGDKDGCTLWDNIVFTEKIMGRTNHFLKVIGEPHGSKVQVDSDGWVNRKLQVKGQPKIYNDKLRFEVDSHNYFDGNEKFVQEVEEVGL